MPKNFNLLSPKIKMEWRSILYCWSCSWEAEEKEFDVLIICGCPGLDIDLITMECPECGHEANHDYEDGCSARLCPKCEGEVLMRTDTYWEKVQEPVDQT